MISLSNILNDFDFDIKSYELNLTTIQECKSMIDCIQRNTQNDHTNLILQDMNNKLESALDYHNSQKIKLVGIFYQLISSLQKNTETYLISENRENLENRKYISENLSEITKAISIFNEFINLDISN